MKKLWESNSAKIKMVDSLQNFGRGVFLASAVSITVEDKLTFETGLSLVALYCFTELSSIIFFEKLRNLKDDE